MSGPIEVGQRWRCIGVPSLTVTITETDRGGRIGYRTAGANCTVYGNPDEFGAFFHRVIPLRIRVGVTADGTWFAAGSNAAAFVQDDSNRDTAIADSLTSAGCGPIVAWHWITAEVPMPDVEQGETCGQVEP